MYSSSKYLKSLKIEKFGYPKFKEFENLKDFLDNCKELNFLDY